MQARTSAWSKLQRARNLASASAPGLTVPVACAVLLFATSPISAQHKKLQGRQLKEMKGSEAWHIASFADLSWLRS